MAVSNFFRKIFGSDASDETDEFDDFERTHGQNTQQLTATEASEEAIAESEELPEELLDAILGVINAQLPPVASQCLDRDAQRRYLSSILGQPLVNYGETLRKKALNELTGDRKKMQQELDELRAERKDLNAKRDEQRATLLSEQRQRKALSDRNRDLENKISELDSEVEQHKLTISAMMNKMRVAEVSEEDSQIMRDEMAQMRNEIAELREQLTRKDETIADKDKEITALAEKVAEYESSSALEAALDQRREAAGEDVAATQAPRKQRSRRKKSVAVYSPEDDSSVGIDSIDWLLPGGAPASHVPHVADPDFGYQPPKHAPEPDSDAQLTLFD